MALYIMARTVLTDNTWEQLQSTMKSHGCHTWKNDRQVMEAILWKLRTGVPWRDIPSELCPWKTAYNRFNRLSKKGLWEQFFLTYEQVLMKNGCSQTEATSAVISIQAVPDEESFEPLENLEVEPPPRFISPSTRMETRLILKSLGVTSTTAKLQTISQRC